MKSRVLALSVLASVLITTVSAQRNVLNNARNTSLVSLSGTIMTLDGHPVRDARVEVHDLMTGALITAGYSMPNGSFSFYNLPTGQYEVRSISGLQEARERVDLNTMDQQVTLRLTETSNQSARGATISVAEMRVPDKARKEFEKAEEAFKKHKVEDARSHCDKSLAAAPTYSRALTLSALFDLSENKLENATRKAEQAVKSDVGYGMGYIVLASVYNSLQRYDDAVGTLERGLPLVPNSWQAHFEMSKALLGKGDYQRSLASADRAQQMVPSGYAPLHLLRAHALLGLKSYTEAIAELEKYLGEDPNGVDTANARKTLDQVKAFVATSQK
jgi:tetratricopeptide (TPR) repeat protein